MNSTAVAAALLTAVSGATILTQTVPPPVQNAVQETRAVTTLARDVAALGAGVDPAWVGWRVPMVPGERELCSTWNDSTRLSRGMLLEGRPDGLPIPVFATPSGPVALEAGSELVVLVRTLAGNVERVRTITGDCPIDAGGRRLTWLTGVTSTESLGYLRTLAVTTPLDTAGAQRIAESAVAAIALHQDAGAYLALTELASRTDMRLRDLAVMWLARARGAEGFAYVNQAIAAAEDPALRLTLARALGQTRETGTPAALLSLARTDRDERARAEAIYWYAQLGSGAAVADVTGLVERDRSAQVRRRGLAGLLRRPSANAVPALLALARTTQDIELRKELVRSLGTSDDSRAVAFMEELVRR